MKLNNQVSAWFCVTLLLVSACAENDLALKPESENYPFRLILDAEEGGALGDAEDYGLEVKFADFTGDLPEVTVTVDFEITDLSDDMVGNVTIDKIVYENDDEETELEFTTDGSGLSGTITLNDPVTGVLPESFEVQFTLPGEEEVFFAEGSFSFSLSNLQSGDESVILGTPNTFEYEVLNHELAGSWELEIDNESDFLMFQEIFGPINHDLGSLSFADVKTGESIEVEFEFDYAEAKIVIAFVNTDDEEVEIEIEAEYDFEEGELEWEGSHEIFGDDGEPEDELDFRIDSEYEIDGDDLTVTFYRVIDEDNFEEGEELFASEAGISWTLEKD